MQVPPALPVPPALRPDLVLAARGSFSSAQRRCGFLMQFVNASFTSQLLTRRCRKAPRNALRSRGAPAHGCSPFPSRRRRTAPPCRHSRTSPPRSAPGWAAAGCNPPPPNLSPVPGSGGGAAALRGGPVQEAEPRNGDGAVPLVRRAAVLTVLPPRAAPRLLSVRGRHEGGQRRGPARHPRRQGGGLAPRTGCGCLRRVPAAGRPQPEPPIPQPAAGGGGAGAEGREGGAARRGRAERPPVLAESSFASPGAGGSALRGLPGAIPEGEKLLP